MFLHNIVNLDLHQAIINKVIYTGKIQKNHSKYHLLSNIILKLSIYHHFIIIIIFNKNQSKLNFD
jgi:hypothetical protein